MGNKKGPSEIFSSEQHLTLQQLLTRQSLAAQKASAQDAFNGKTGEIDDSAAGEQPDRTSKWHLISRGIKLHEWQTICIEKWLESGRGTVKVATGGGKTIFALAAAEALQRYQVPDLKLAIIVPTIPLMHQWLDELRDANVPTAKIALMGGGESIPDDADLKILICVLNSARDRLPALVERFNWSSNLLLVVDECHRANATEARKIFDTHPAYTLGLSATPETDQGDPNIPSDEAYALSDVGRGLGPIIYEFSLKESLAAGLLTPFEVWHVGLPLNPEEATEHSRLSSEISELRKDLQVAHRRSKSSQNFIAWCQTVASREGAFDAARFIAMANERKRLIYSATARAQLTLKILSAAMEEADRRVIVFHESIEEINNLFVLAMDANVPAVLEHSKLPAGIRAGNIDIFRRGIARTIVSAKSLVEGFNVPSADLGVIAASSGSVRQRIQSLGRMLRTKASGGTATIFVLYVKNTEDESIYQKADWEAVVGAERNRYFEWTPDVEDVRLPTDLHEFLGQLSEVGTPPRPYRPPCHEIDPNLLEFGSEYPGQTTGIELRIDQAGNLKTSDGALIRAPKDVIEKIIALNQYRRAVRTPCGHLICRTGANNQPSDIWIFLGRVVEPESEPVGFVEKLLVKSASGRRVISKKSGRNEVYARGPDKARSEEAGETQKMLLEWVRTQEEERSSNIRELFWDGASEYWIEVDSERIKFEGAIGPLEFPQ